LEYVPCPASIFKDIKKLPPGHSLTFGDGELKVRRYWDVPPPEPVRLTLSEETVKAQELLDLLGEAVDSRLVSDVPLGVFLSGGIDSTSVAALMCQRARDRVKKFSIAFDVRSFDESHYARLAAHFLGTDHYEEKLDSGKILELIPKVGPLLDEPFADASFIPTYLLSSFARRYVTVALGGDGGDELFGGYPK